MVMNMKPVLIGDSAWRYFRYAPNKYPVCAACGVTVLRIREACEVQVHEHSGPLVICHQCYSVGSAVPSSFDKLSDPCTLEELKEATNAEERISARENANKLQRAKNAKQYRSEKSKKAARTRAKNKSASSGVESGDSGSDKSARKKSSGLGSKKSRITKVRKPKRKKVVSVDND